MAKIVGKYLVNAFSLNMLPDDNEAWYRLYIKRLSTKEFCDEIKSNVKNAIGHQSTIDLVNQLCNMNLTPNRIEIHLEFADPDDDSLESWKNVLYVIQVSLRLQEGKVLSTEELERLLNEGKIKLLKIEISDLMREADEELAEEEEGDEE
ncbi:STIV orfB116 family protein [Acidianus manzaensis]|uniref:Uncharacterized protein n=1 Tax=Acidianus manzaensis TaxID=282676 RepID=A0A1W6K1H5_9CREN|nr:DUF1874 domain-containing protein [Acidianus manzaensis]ARM76376.1 hypothetical protein B6F84_10330 [Acidianus manzaensis]